MPLLALPAGQLADRLPRRTLLAAATVLEAAVFAGLLAVTLAGRDELWPFLRARLGTGVASALGSPAGRALTPSLVPQEILVAALASALGRVPGRPSSSGPALGGLLFSLRPELVYAVAAGLSLVVGRVCARDRPAASRASSGRARPRKRARRGAADPADPVLFGAISLDLFAVLFGGAVALLPVFAKDVLDVGPVGLGVLRTAPAVGRSRPL